MRRFYISPDALNSDPVILDQEESHHLTRVLRLREGDEVELFDGTGALYTGTIDKIGKQVAVSPASLIQAPGERQGGSIIVCQGDLKGGKMDFLVEKCTELGVERLIPFSAGRSQGRLDGQRLQQRWQRRMSIVKKACKQSGRLRFMQVDMERSFAELLEIDFGPSHSKCFFWEKAKSLTLAEAISGQTDGGVFLMIGPEGGFSDEEATLALGSGWQAVSLGDLILRAETATITVVAVINHLLGRM
ncbi:MAG: 16S rRNA (uracil(1498)-N(3))-methyltransferase [Desulfofustis sp.]|nr:16S rRNA (uracil(1498)-N(3))-methyltransferase [Desulfofustis sp.]